MSVIPNHNIGQVIERAARAYVIANRPAWLDEFHIYRGIENREDESMQGEWSTIRRYPCVIVLSESAQAVLPNWHGLWTGRLTVEVWGSRRETADVNDSRAKEIFNLFCVSEYDLATALRNSFATATENAETLSLRAAIPQEMGYRVEGYGWCSWMSFDLHQVSQP
jgi:hypothetical protein